MWRPWLCGIFLVGGMASAAPPDSGSLMGIHWYGNTSSISAGTRTDVEDMTADTGVWITEITHLDAAAAPAWDAPSYYASHCQKAAQGKGHAFVMRIQPYWSCNVPHPDDPFSVTDYANAARDAAWTLRDWVHVWQVGNEVNIRGENHRWNPDSNNYTGPQWEPTPEQYAETYVAVREAIHDQSAAVAPKQQIVLMQATGPGFVDVYRYMDGNEFLYRMIDAIEDKSKIDGFGLHSYAEPGGPNDGVDGFMDALREQLMIINSFGLGDRPVFVTEFNKHMPNQNEAIIGARFLGKAFEALHSWNEGTGGIWPGTPNHNIVGATWFVYPGGGWNDYSLFEWKSAISSTSPDQNPWYSFRSTIQTHGYPAGALGGGPIAVPHNRPWWTDEFDSLDHQPPLPDWRTDRVSLGSATVSDGRLLLRGNGSSFGGASVRSSGYAFSDFRLEATLVLTDSRRSSGGNEANFEIRVREGSRGYSLTFFTDDSDQDTNQIVLRRVNNWGENIDSLRSTVGGDGIASGDTFHVAIEAEGPELRFLVREEDTDIPVVEWTATDSEQHTGMIRLSTYNLTELAVESVHVGGLEMSDANGDGMVTPGDAQAVFDCYLSGSCEAGISAAAANRCGVSESGITPADAQGVFNQAMGILPTCQ